MKKAYQKKVILIIGISLFTHFALAETVATSVSCGKDCTYTLTAMDNGHKIATIDTGVTAIPSGAFKNTTINEIIIPKGVTSIGSQAFYYSNVETVSLPEGIVSIGSEAFSGTKKLTSMNIPDSVRVIGDWAFGGTNLNDITLSDSVISIGQNAFGNTTGATSHLTQIFCSKSKSENTQNGKCNIPSSAFMDPRYPGYTFSRENMINFGYYVDDKETELRTFYNSDGTLANRRPENLYELKQLETGAILAYDKKGKFQKMRGKRIYTVEEMVEATSNGNKFNFNIRYR